MARKQNIYFDTFEAMIDLAAQAANFLHDALTNFSPESLEGQMEKLHEIEHLADEKKHVMMTQLAAEFVTPIDREDILLLANEIDEVVDKVEDVLIRMYMYNVKAIRKEATEFTDVVKRSCVRLQAAMKDFSNFKKTKELHQAVVDVNTMEEEGDAIYIRAVRDLYTSETDPVEIIVWSENFDRLEECCDACEHVSNVMESIAMKNG